MNKTSGPAAGILVEVADAPLLQNRKAPQYIRQQELPNHRVIIELSAKGYTAREIAKLVDQSPTQVQDILRQPQYQQNIANTIRRVQLKPWLRFATTQTRLMPLDSPRQIKSLRDVMAKPTSQSIKDLR